MEHSREIRPFIVMEVLEKALSLEREGRSIVHLEVGEPDFCTPPRIVRSAMEALSKGDTHYTDSRGTAELRMAIARHFAKKYGASVPEERVIVTMGTSPAMLLVLSLLIEEPGDEIIIPDPGYPCYPNFIRYLRGVPRCIPVRASDGFQLKPDDVRAAVGPRTRAVIVNSPSNPAGTLMPRDDLAEISGIGIPVISDEIYHGLVYGEQEHSVLEFTDESFVLNGFSKLYAMTGWRLGYIVAPAQRIRRLQILQQNFFISPNSFVQRGGIAALTEDHPEIEDMKRQYDARRRYLCDALPRLGLPFAVEPKGAFYFFVNAKEIEPDSYRLAFDILESAGVALTPGIDFGDHGEGHMRISYANSLENIVEGMRRLSLYVERRAQ
jgi:aspartate/methionine/tyrosine aminotransferase